MMFTIIYYNIIFYFLIFWFLTAIYSNFSYIQLPAKIHNYDIINYRLSGTNREN